MFLYRCDTAYTGVAMLEELGAVVGTAIFSDTTTSQLFVLGGPIVRVESDYFVRLVSDKRENFLVVHTVIGIFSKSHIYATSYKGFTLVTKTKDPLPIVPDVEAESIWLPVAV